MPAPVHVDRTHGALAVRSARPLRSRLVVTLGGFGLGVVLVGMESACDPLSPLRVDECDPGTTPPSCIGPSTYQECSSGEGHHVLHEIACPEGRSCNPTPNGGSPCDGVTEGGACTNDHGCKDELRCEANVCAGPTKEEIARCEAAFEIHVPDDGSEVQVDVPLSSTSRLAERIHGPVCAFGGSPRRPFEADGFARVVVSGEDPAGLQLFLDDDVESFPEGVGFDEVLCSQLFSINSPCDIQDAREGPFRVSKNAYTHSLTVFFFAPVAQVGTVHVRLKKNPPANGGT